MPKPSNTPRRDHTFLGIDTGASQVTVAVCNAGVIHESSLPLGRSSNGLLGAIDRTLTEAGMAVQELDGILCTAGPGSFTGLRIGMATVLGLHESLDVPAVALPSLWVQASAALSTQVDLPDAACASALAAHRDQAYVQVFALAPELKSRGPIITTPDLLDESDRTLPLVSADDKLRAQYEHAGGRAIDPGSLARGLVQLAMRSLPGQNMLLSWDSASLTKPLYADTPAVAARPRAIPAAQQRQND